MKRFLIEVYTNWCGEQNEFSAYANNDSELEDLAQQLSYNNFSGFGGFESVLEEMFPDVEEYTTEMEEDAAEEEGGYYNYIIEEWDETRPEEEWDWYELIYDGREKENAEV